jgi:transcriptional regulator with XRE-family HTH domain
MYDENRWASLDAGDELKRRRTSCKWTAADVADRVGVTKATVYNWERYGRIPTKNHQKLDEVFGRVDSSLFPASAEYTGDIVELLGRIESLLQTLVALHDEPLVLSRQRA